MSNSIAWGWNWQWAIRLANCSQPTSSIANCQLLQLTPRLAIAPNPSQAAPDSYTVFAPQKPVLGSARS